MGTPITTNSQNLNIIVEYFKYLHSMKNDARCKHDINSRIAMEKVAFNKNKTLFTRKLGLNLTNNWCKVLRLDHSFLLC
jgi:hypothetical protein